MGEPDWAADRVYLLFIARWLRQPGVHHDTDLSDAVQESLAVAHEKRAQCRATTQAEWRGWLRSILRDKLRGILPKNLHALRWFEESSRRLEEALAADQTTPSQAFVLADNLEGLARALAELPEDERTAIELKHLHEFSVKFISARMGRTEQSVEGLLKRGRKRLRELLERRG